MRCVRNTCHRAAIILIGLASEDACSSLLDVLARYPSQDPKNGDWRIVASEPVFSKRWGAAVRVVRKIKDGLRPAARGQDWWRPLDPIPEWLLPLGEAMRLARNEAAHVADRDFTPGEVLVLLAAIPTQLELVAALAAFLASPPAGVTLPAV